jgi:1-aminocyclopropane-1-carboxylate deaminase/D-cysteine desulfhydrase-like pyridoxal-dependent ACC family enzyme
MRNIPRLRFAHLPTPVESMPRLASALGGGLRLLIKRDDQTGLALGGNKTRKLEFLVAEAQANGARRLFTAGAAQSNHCRQTAAAAARNGFGCTLVLVAAAGQPQPATEISCLIACSAPRLFGPGEEREQVLQDVFQQAWQAGERPYLIPYGGSNTTGAAAYVFAMQELLGQGENPDWVIFPSSSGGTQAGLVLGARLFGFQGKVQGISVDEPQLVLQERVARLATETADFLGEQAIFQANEILANADYLGGGYGVMGEVEREAIRLFAHAEGILLDPVYTGRAAAGMIDLIRKGVFESGQTVLFWHTGGAPALFAEQYEGRVV